MRTLSTDFARRPASRKRALAPRALRAIRSICERGEALVNACKEVSFDRNEGVPLAFSVCIQRGPARNRASILRFLDDQFMSMGDSMMTAEFALEGDQPIMAAMMVEGLLALTHELGDWLK